MSKHSEHKNANWHTCLECAKAFMEVGIKGEIVSEIKLSRNELKTLLYVGRQLELVACLMPMAQPQARMVKAQRSYGYDMLRQDGSVSRLDFEAGQQVYGVSPAGNGFTEVVVKMPDGEVAARYRLL